MGNRVGGIIFVKINGAQFRAKGSFSYGLGNNKREAVIGSDGVHGYKEIPQVAFIEGVFTDDEKISLKNLQSTKDATVTLDLANGKTIALKEAWFAGEGNASTEEGEIQVRFESKKEAQEVR